MEGKFTFLFFAEFAPSICACRQAQISVNNVNE